jgi:large subunit ribosomal protein L4
MECVVYNKLGSEAKKIELKEALFGIKDKDQAIYDKIKNELANKRQGTAATKTRGMVSGGGKKPFKQKGTGRARAGSNRSPLWVGGGAVFGPQPHSFRYSLPKKLKRLALFATLSKKFHQGIVSLVEDFSVESGKTKDALVIINKIKKNDSKRVLLIHSEEDALLKRSLRNVSWLKFMSSKRMAVHELFYAKEVLIMESALKDLETHYKMNKGEA